MFEVWEHGEQSGPLRHASLPDEGTWTRGEDCRPDRSKFTVLDTFENFLNFYDRPISFP